jgi:hypothetical protein
MLWMDKDPWVVKCADVKVPVRKDNITKVLQGLWISR